MCYFLLKRFIVLKDSISLVLTLKRTSLCRFTSKKRRYQGILAISFTTSRSVSYFTNIFIRNGKQLFTFFKFNCFSISEPNALLYQNPLSKWFFQKKFFSLREIRVFIIFDLNLVVLQLNLVVLFMVMIQKVAWM